MARLNLVFDIRDGHVVNTIITDNDTKCGVALADLNGNAKQFYHDTVRTIIGKDILQYIKEMLMSKKQSNKYNGVIPMNTYEIVVNHKIIETIEQQGRSDNALIYILMDRVYQLTKATKSLVEVYNRTRGCMYYV